MRVTFVDTSILCNVLPVPGRDQDGVEVRREMVAREREGERFILPVTAVIETGNFVAQLADGGERRRTAELLVDVVRLVARGRSPWTLHQFAWDADFLTALMDGHGTGATLVDHAANKVGAGDL